ncbi:mandelate racemase/muconate lactonizing enzyme family protein [Candidatus Persebacteraceae bacterium Df01]|uniref:Mandelate racemase/muconate lactonizing enzyme family protein n=1 Tax=Candidatus Doriopsillibacter californiensis TaxID=2970740 RepID=A0ABT7QKA0_9GAMM|nr:mandelate racemase/muconate lactonizing enzyme family protein [Candidatus Persebacteraceae bacterium Df01]
MKITDAKTFVVANPPPSRGGSYWVFVKLTTDNGISGVGELYGAPFHPQALEAMIADVCERHVFGSDPFATERLYRIVYSRNYTQRPDASLVAVLSAVETACWDIVGKALEQPVCRLLGGPVRERLRSYSYLYPEDGDTGCVYTDSDLAAERATAYVKHGFTAVKFDPIDTYSAFDPRQLSLAELSRAETIVRKMREAVGDSCDLLIGTHGQMTPAAALRLARRLEPYDPLWLEEPVPPENPTAMAKVAQATRIPIATGERLCTKQEFARLLEAGGAAILQPALGRMGGIGEMKKVAALAETYYTQLAPHCYCGPIEAAANIHLAAAIPNFLILESIHTFGGFHADILSVPLQWEDGYVTVPTAPGLGVELNESVANAHPYNDDALHLTPCNTPD